MALMLGLGLFGASPHALAASPIVAPDHLPTMTMQVVRSNDPSCANRCSDWIALDGPIGIGSAAKFAKLIQSLKERSLPVLINSGGGSVADAMAIGRLIRAKHLDVAVTKTVLTSCPSDRSACETLTPPGVTTAAPVVHHAVCASACSFILAGGERRFVALNAFVGVHQFRMFQKYSKVMRTFRILTRTVNGVKTEISRTMVAVRPISTTELQVKTPAAAYAGAQAYFESMGITPRLMSLAEETAPDSIHWLSLAELYATKMDTEGKDGAYLIAHTTRGIPDETSPAHLASPTVGPMPDLPPGWSGATLISEGQDDRQPLNLVGHVFWSVDPTPSCPALHAEVELPAGAGGATVRIVDLGTETGVPDYRIKLTLHPGPNSPFRVVSAIGLPAVRMAPQQPPIDLQAEVSWPMLGTYDIDLTTTGDGAEMNRRVMKDGQALEFPLTVYPLRNLRIVLERGQAGVAAFQLWRSLVDDKHHTS